MFVNLDILEHVLNTKYHATPIMVNTLIPDRLSYHLMRADSGFTKCRAGKSRWRYFNRLPPI